MTTAPARHVASQALAACAALVIAVSALVAWIQPRVKKIPRLDPAAVAWPDNTFRDHAYFAETSEIPAGLTTRGSRKDGVEFRGGFVSGWFAAAPRVTLMVSGFPHLGGNALAIECANAAGTITSIPFAHVDPRDSWRPWNVSLPADATRFRIRAIDGESGTNGWLAVSEPFEPTLLPAVLPQTERALLAFAIQALLFGVIGYGATWCFRGRAASLIEQPCLPLLAGAAVALLGYAAFWIYFAHPLAGRIFSWSVCGAACVPAFLCERNLAGPWRAHRGLVLLAIAVGFLFLSLLVLFEPPRLSFAAANRFVEGLPSDNEIPRALADRLWKGESPRQLWGDWLSSDRPPLQSGCILITWPVLRGLGFDVDTLSTTGGICAQLLWVFAVGALAEFLGATRRQALAVVAGVACTGVMLVFSVFVWPKLLAAALVIAAWLLWLHPSQENPGTRFVAGGLCAALGWLSHGGVAFSLIALAPLPWVLRKRVAVRNWLLAALAFAALAAPWMAYQRFYEPPGNRLLKMHLAGVDNPDPRGVLETLRSSYLQVGVSGALANKWSNVTMQFRGAWSRLWSFDGFARRGELRVDEFTFGLRACAWWLLALAVPVIGWARRGRLGSPPGLPTVRAVLWWLAGGVIVWLALMFLPNVASIHQGTLVTPLLLLTLLAWWAQQFDARLFAALAVVQMAWFAIVWVPASDSAVGHWQLLPAGIAFVSAMVLAWFVARALVHRPVPDGSGQPR